MTQKAHFLLWIGHLKINALMHKQGEDFVVVVSFKNMLQH